jgi:microcystin degradation protein MlrC
VNGKVRRISNGRFQYTGGILGGTWATMGPAALLEVGSIQILIATYPTYDWADEQYRSMGMNPEKAKFVGVKNMMNFRFGYRDIMKGFFVLDLTRANSTGYAHAAFQEGKTAVVSSR